MPTSNPKCPGGHPGEDTLSFCNEDRILLIYVPLFTFTSDVLRVSPFTQQPVLTLGS